jgi:isopentenyl-diphosphate delta-isomerase
MTDLNTRLVSFDDEQIILVNQHDDQIGRDTKLACHQGEGILHRAFSIFIFNSQGQLLIQKRSDKKLLWPQYWANSCCSHPLDGENIDDAVNRRLSQELNLTSRLTFIDKFEYRSEYLEIGTEHELCSIYIGLSDKFPGINENEVAEIKYLNVQQVDQLMLDDQVNVAPWFKLEWQMLRQQHWLSVEKMLLNY